jgi:hypothetical protein
MAPLKKHVFAMISVLATLVGLVGVSVLGAPAAHATRTVYLIAEHHSMYVANLCLKNLSKEEIEQCTGRVPVDSVRELKIPYDEGDQLQFIVAAVAGHNAFKIIPNGSNVCGSGGTSIRPTIYCGWNSKYPG